MVRAAFSKNNSSIGMIQPAIFVSPAWVHRQMPADKHVCALSSAFGACAYCFESQKMNRGEVIHALRCRLLFSVYSAADVGVSLCVHGW